MVEVKKLKVEDEIKEKVISKLNEQIEKSTAEKEQTENIINNILKKECRLHEELALFIAEELREPAVYYTILSALASDCCKLNDIYKHTGFSRAKISVYLKNLLELEFVEKVSSGTYQISNAYVKFYFRFLFPHMSRWNSLSPEDYYRQYIEAYLPYSKGGI